MPDEWQSGTFKGVCARGAFELDYTWQNKQLTQLKITSKAGEICRLEGNPNMKISSNGQPVAFNTLADGVVEFKTVRGGVYVVE